VDWAGPTCTSGVGIAIDSEGRFSQLLPAGTYTAKVYAGAELGTFSFTVLAGQTTDVDMGTTPTGSNVSVDLSGGIADVGGLSLDFSQVGTAGNTTVVESGGGPPPPTGFRIVGTSGQPRYWDINTTASYSGPITVCIHYDGTQVQGSESSLRLVHDDGSGWQDVTTSLDTTADIICGSATSLSPFAVVEALVPPDADSDGVPDSADVCSGTANATVVNATGCSLDQVVPCVPTSGPWKNHGAYVSAFTHAAQAFYDQHLIDRATLDALVASAARSTCGKPAAAH
jgi:hypothetical protein